MEIDQRSESEIGSNEDEIREDGESIEAPYRPRSSKKRQSMKLEEEGEGEYGHRRRKKELDKDWQPGDADQDEETRSRLPTTRNLQDVLWQWHEPDPKTDEGRQEAERLRKIKTTEGDSGEEQDQETTQDYDDQQPLACEITHWRQAIEQWEKGDPEQGFMPIRDWPKQWRKGAGTMKLYLRLKAIADEFEFCGRDEYRMRELHGDITDRPGELVDSIRHRIRILKKHGKTVKLEVDKGAKAPVTRKRKGTVDEDR
ncbi:hypothetical protein BGZ74_006342 [Mortierella antarctica]|nr:hypothetical protein BGZ74_006342 [Mortierella antarctica]